MKLSDKVILTDCDGVLLDWQYGFFRWMRALGFEPIFDGEYDIAKTFDIDEKDAKSYVLQFNESAAIGWLPQFRDAVKYVRMLHEDHGYIFHCITSLSTDQYAGKLRTKNLEALFGKTVFEKIECLECGADKDDALKPYADTGCLWIEDKPENAVIGEQLGLNSILIEHDHNENFEHPFITKVQNWREIYEMLV